jgi:hypothetical protein
MDVITCDILLRIIIISGCMTDIFMLVFVTPKVHSPWKYLRVGANSNTANDSDDACEALETEERRQGNEDHEKKKIKMDNYAHDHECPKKVIKVLERMFETKVGENIPRKSKSICYDISLRDTRDNC